MTTVGLVISFLFANNLMFYYFMGTHPLFEDRRSFSRLFSFALLMTVALLTVSMLSWTVFTLLLKPFKLFFLQTPVFVLILWAVCEFYGWLKARNRSWSELPQSREILLNGALLGLSLLLATEAADPLHALAGALAGAAGYFMALLIVFFLQTRWARAMIPFTFQGVPAQLISAGLVSLVLSGFDSVFRSNGVI